MDTLSVRPFVGSVEVSHHRLRNGLEVLLAEDHGAPVVSFHTWYRVGSSDEREGTTGIAHLFEHMMFKETTEYPDGHWSRQVEEAGSPDNNAFTWMDETVYTQSLPAEKLEMIARLEAIRMERLVVDEKQLEAEREVVLNERRFRSEDDPYGRLGESLWALAFGVHPYRWPTIGWRKDIEAISVADARAFYRDFYAPDNATVIVVGDFRTDEALDTIERFYGPIPASEVRRPAKPEEPAQVRARRVALPLQVESEILDLGYKIPGFRHVDWPALTLLDGVLTAGNAAWLQRRLVDSGLAASAQGSLPPFLHPSLYQFTVTLREGKAAASAEAAIRDMLASIARDGVAQADVDRARHQLLKSSWEGLDSAAGKADFLGWYQVIGGDWRGGLDRLEALRHVGSDDVARVAARYFAPERATAAVAYPSARPSPRRVARALPAAPPAPAPGPALPGPRGPRPASAPTKEVRVALAPSGVKVLASVDPTLPVIEVQVAFAAGARADRERKAGLASLAAEAMLRGTRRRTREQFETDLERMGANLDVSVSSDFVVFGGSTLARSWPAFAELLREALHEPAFEPAQFKLLKDEVLASIQEQRNDDRALASDRFRREVYGAHPYGRGVRGTTATVRAAKASDAADFWSETLRGTGAVVGLSGQVDDDCVADAASLLDGLPRLAHPLPVPAPPERLPGRRLVIVDKPERTQTQMFVGHPALAIGDPRFPAFAVGNNAFGGYNFTTRLMDEVRVKRGWSYGAYGSLRQGLHGGSYSIWVFPAEDQAPDCLALVLDLYARVSRDGLLPEEIAFGRNALVNTAAFLQDTAAKRLGLQVTKLLTGHDSLRAIDEAKVVNPDAVNRVLGEVYDPDRLVAVVVGTADRIRGPLMAATGIEDVTVVPYDAE